ncbi:uncharacterized protein LOC102709130 [Oryza brachyantha]|uniref:DUF1618 domain-containing protein n=1 Tax=Oryza brachyantha TaxID=4533 RepID=J3KY73_ORYBR|nr:uncharacterized protein LOC102709130 [Oryza brachyantha]
MAELEMARLQEEKAAEEVRRAAAQAPWVILVCVPHVVHEEGDFPPGRELRLSLADPPLASRLTVPLRIAPDCKTAENYPYLAAAGPHGRLLLYATQGPDPEPPALDAFYSRPLGVHHGFDKAYFVLDAYTRRAYRLPDPDDDNYYDTTLAILHPGNVGLLSYSTCYYVAELQPAPAAGTATLLLYSSLHDMWDDKDLIYPLGDRPWGSNGVVTYQGMLWWVDLSYGLLSCDVVYGLPPLLHFVPLPEGCELPAGTPDLEKIRCVGVGAARLRYVQIEKRDGDHVVTMWTLIDEQVGTWHLDCEASFKAIWDDEGYKETKLPREVPTVALIHPAHTGDVVYFFLHSRLFAVDLQTCRVLEWRFFAMLQPPMAYHSSQFVRAWWTPPTLYWDSGMFSHVAMLVRNLGY